MTLWGGRFSSGLDRRAWEFNSSLRFDRRLALQDVRGSAAWAGALVKAGVLTEEEHLTLLNGLAAVAGEFENGSFVFAETDEDIHTAVERRLGELAGPAAGKLHTGRSRNDQVATDFRLWMLDMLPGLDRAIGGLQASLVNLAEKHQGVIMPGYTHLQRAQPVTLAHWLLSHFWPLQRDRERLADLRPRMAVMPLGSGALAGTPFSIDRAALAASLGFDRPSPNSLDAVADRDFAVEFLFCASLTGIHLSRLAEAVVLFSTAEFGFFRLPDAFSTGSSLMPQKKNPDVFELARGKAGTLLGLLTGLMVTLKGLPSAYDKDLQEDKEPVFKATDTLLEALPVLAGAMASMQVDAGRMRAAVDPVMMATELADSLVRKGVPFREAHAAAGRAVLLAERKGIKLVELSAEDWQEAGPFGSDAALCFDPLEAINRRSATGGTGMEAVKAQIQAARELLNRPGAGQDQPFPG